MTKRRAARTAALLLLALLPGLLTGCVGETPADETAGRTTISLFMVESHWEAAGEAMLEKFMQENPDISIQSIMLSNTDSIQFTETRAAAGNLPDVTCIDPNSLGVSAAKRGQLMDLSDTEAAKHISEADKAAFTTDDGLLFGLTYGSATSFLYCNLKVFRSAGIDELPTDFEELMSDCRILRNAGYIPIALAGMHTTVSMLPWDSILGNTYGPVYGEGWVEQSLQNGTLDLTDERGLRAMNMLKLLSSDFQRNVAGTDEVPAHDLLNQGKAAMLLGGNWTANYSEKLGDDLAIIIPPFNRPGQNTWVVTAPETGVGISNTHREEHVCEAKLRFFEWFWEPQHYRYMQNATGNIPSIDNAEDVRILPQIQELLPEIQGSPSVRMNYDAAYDNAQHDRIQKLLDDFYVGALTSKDAARQITEAIRLDVRQWGANA